MERNYTGLNIKDTGMSINNDGLTVSSTGGGMSVNSAGVALTGGLTIHSERLTAVSEWQSLPRIW